VQDTDRLLDETTGDTYIVVSVTRPPTIIGAPVDLVLSLKRISANSV
jgi:type IV secretory pathway VirB3-like protein